MGPIVPKTFPQIIAGQAKCHCGLQKAQFISTIKSGAFKAQAVEGLFADHLGHGVGQLDLTTSAKFFFTKIIKDFGLQEFNVDAFPNPNRIMRRGSVFAGRDLAVIAKCIKEKKPFKKIEFKVSNESAWEVGLACGGEIAIFLEQINE